VLASVCVKSVFWVECVCMCVCVCVCVHVCVLCKKVLMVLMLAQMSDLDINYTSDTCSPWLLPLLNMVK
jgi:hypothetical protein